MEIATATFKSLLLLCAFFSRDCSAQRPSTGVLLFLENEVDTAANADGEVIQNNGLVSGGRLHHEYGLACYSALSNTDSIGEWTFPDGSSVQSAGNEVVFAQRQLGRVTLQVREGRELSSAIEGVYSCSIPDETGTTRTLYAGVYSVNTFDNLAGPVVAAPVEFNLLSHNYHYPPTFSVNCSTSVSPPTSLSWAFNGSLLDLSDSSFSSSQQLRDGGSSTYDNILTVTGARVGQYSCLVSNVKGNHSGNITVKGPSSAPMSVTVTSTGNNSVQVSWAPPSGDVRGYRLFYTSGSVTRTLAVGNATSAVVRNVSLGVQYSFTVQAFADFPSQNSSVYTITLNDPSPPQSVTVVSESPTTLAVSWTGSVTSGVNGYEVTYSPGDGSCDGIVGGRVMVEGGSVMNLQLTDLEAYTEYMVAVRSRTAEGFGSTFTAQMRTTMADKPGPPQMVSVTPLTSSKQIFVQWEEPACSDINDNSVTEYTVRYRLSSGQTQQVNTSTTSYTIRLYFDNSLQLFTDYFIEVAAVNRRGEGQFSQPQTAVITGAPGLVSSLSTLSDILSVVLNWSPPQVGAEHITKYEIRHSQDSYLLGVNEVGGEATSYRVQSLMPGTEYVFEIKAVVDFLEGPSEKVTGTTSVLRQVQGVSVQQLNSLAVNVSWTRLISEDVFYRVYYSSPDGQADFSGNSSWGVVGRLRGQTMFQVVAVVNIQGIVTEGDRSPVSCAGGECPSEDPSAIAGSVIGATLLVALMIVVFVIIYLMWNRGRSGKFQVNRRRSNALDLKSRHNPLPLPDFDRRPSITIAKPIIVKQPKDVIALEGEKVSIAPEVAGIPPPTIAWYHEGSMVTADYATEISEKGELSFVCIEKKHAGVYKFTVSNNAGSIQGQVSLFVRSEDDDIDTAGIPQIESSCISVSEFGKYAEENHLNSNRGFRDQYFCLGSAEEGHQVKCALLPENKNLNRFTNITVYDDNRVKLKAIGGRPDCHHDYINASYIDGYFLPKKFITTQGPTDKTSTDFWRLVWQVRAPTIVMITNLVELGRVKCNQYWPDAGAKEFGPFKVILKEESVFADYTVRIFILILTTKTQPPMKVVQYHFTSWPDHGVPEYVSPMLAFHRRINADHKSARGPMIVHCSAGVGRSGTFIAIDVALQQAEGEAAVDIPSIVTKLRSQRMKMVQTVEQYVFIHDAVLESVMCGNTQIPAEDFRTTFESLKQITPDNEQSGFQSQFNVLEQVTPKFDLSLCPTAVQNEDKNRSMDNVPTDRWRVILKAEHPDYINANFVNGYKKKKAFIVTQGPLENTCRDFWKMVYERDSSSIVMLSGIVENDKEICHRYWPQTGMQQYGEFSVSVMEESMHEGHLERVFSVTDSKSGQAHRVSQFQVFGWNTDGTSTNPRSIIGAITSSLLLQKRNNSGPIVVHCSDMMIRSAMFCALATCIECCKIEGSIDVFQVVKTLRHQKPGAFPTLKYYQMMYDLLVFYLEEAGGLVDSSSMFQ